MPRAVWFTSIDKVTSSAAYGAEEDDDADMVAGSILQTAPILCKRTLTEVVVMSKPFAVKYSMAKAVATVLERDAHCR